MVDGHWHVVGAVGDSAQGWTVRVAQVGHTGHVAIGIVDEFLDGSQVVDGTHAMQGLGRIVAEIQAIWLNF